MAKIGNLGSQIVFKVSDSYVLTMNDFTQKVSGKWNKHDIMYGKPKYEFNGPDLRTISFDITLDAVLGVRPKNVLKTLENMVENGTAEILVVGGRQIGSNSWIIADISEKWDVIYNGGELVRATCTLNLKEYT